MLELSSGSTVVGEDSGSVAPLVAVDKGDGFIESLGFDGAENRTEDLFFVSLHAGLAAGDDGWADEVTLLVARYSRVSAVEEKVAAISDGLIKYVNSTQPNSMINGNYHSLSFT